MLVLDNSCHYTVCQVRSC